MGKLPSLRDSAKQNRGNPQNNYLDFAFAESTLNCHFERSEKSHNFKKRDSSLRTSHFAQNDKNILPLPNARGFAQSLPLPCGGGLRGWVDSQNNSSAKFSNSDFTHPLAPSAREGEFLNRLSLREGRQIADSTIHAKSTESITKIHRFCDKALK
ncbi:hypothetical protein ACWIUD_10280 [Helicobacter sp. 23-1044]